MVCRVYLQVRQGKVVETAKHGDVLIDLDKDGYVIGIEFLDINSVEGYGKNMTKRITRDEVLAELHKIVADYPKNWSYKDQYAKLGNPKDGLACEYVINGEPGCLVGVYLHRTGTTIEHLMTLDIQKDENEDTKWINQDDTESFTRGANKLLDHCQFAQDMGHSWKYAVEYAEETTKGME